MKMTEEQENIYYKNPISRHLFEELKEVRMESIAKWEGVTGEEIKAFDNSHSINDWVAYIAEYGSRSRVNPETFRADMLKVANIALAAVAAIDRQVSLIVEP